MKYLKLIKEEAIEWAHYNSLKLKNGSILECIDIEKINTANKECSFQVTCKNYFGNHLKIIFFSDESKIINNIVKKKKKNRHPFTKNFLIKKT